MSEDATLEECFKEADNVLNNACACIAEIIDVQGIINVDFEDVKTIMSEPGKAMMGTAVASGPDRARIADALEKLPDNGDIKELKGHKGWFRLRVGTYRIIYTVDNGQLIVRVVDAGNHGQIYNRY